MVTKQIDLYPQHVFGPKGFTANKALGRVPSNEVFAIVHVFARPGKQALVLAMAMRPEGVTAAQMAQSSMLFDGKATYHRNKLKAQHQGTSAPFDGGLRDGAYHLTLNANGKAIVARKAEGAVSKPTGAVKGKPATPVAPKAVKRPSKPRKPATVPMQAPPTPVEAQPATDGQG